MDDTCSVSSVHSDGSQQSTKTTQTIATRIPVRLTRAQRLANEKRRQQREKREKREKQELKASEPFRKNERFGRPPSVKQRKPRSNISARIHKSQNVQSQSQNVQTCPIKVLNANDVSFSIPDTRYKLELEPEGTIKIQKRLLLQTKVQDLLRQMIDDFVSICSIAHYMKIDGLYIKQDSKKCWDALNADKPDKLPLACEGRENWIERKKKDYPLLLTDLLARGCFQSELKSDFPSVEVFRMSYISAKTARRSLLEGYTAWELFGSSAFTFKVIKELQWNKIQIEYDDKKVENAKTECLQGNSDWGYIFWHLGKDGLKYSKV